ncbi:MAG TPA: methyltransferase domain-containing protein, partial [Caulobacteraceae bacterium]|nr:methyltransferase domain-containing protein [Caulobacteraceae bacterium]
MTDTATSTEGPNAGQAAYWNTLAGATWVAMQDKLDRQIAGVGAATIAVLDPRPGEKILDVGCGCGASSLELARAVGATGEVLGLDISAPMLEVARRRAAEAGLAQARFQVGDAQVWPFEPGTYDALFSRFGVMFFADPTAAFSNLRRALKPDGRMTFLCWRTVADNPIMTVPGAAAAKLFPAEPPASPPDPNAPGPFAFADGERLRG